MDTVVCLTLDKWETVSGHFGGYLTEHVPVGPDWLYEIKHDAYRLMVRKTGDRVCIYTRRGADWTKRFPRIV